MNDDNHDSSYEYEPNSSDIDNKIDLEESVDEHEVSHFLDIGET